MACFRLVDMFFDLSLWSLARVFYMTHAEGTNQAWNSLGNKTIEPIRYQLNASEYFFVSSHLRIFKSAQDNTLFQQSFERIIGLFATN